MAKQDDSAATSNPPPAPPEGWQWAVSIGWPFAGQLAGGESKLVPVGNRLYPSRFVLLLRPPAPPGAWIRIMCEIVDGDVTMPIMVAEGIDTPRAADMVRKAMPMKTWIDLALIYLSIQMLMEQARRIGDVNAASRILRATDTEAATALETLSKSPAGALIGASETDIAALQADPDWIHALESVRSEFDQEGLRIPPKTPLRGTPRRNSVTREHLREVADEYRKAAEQGLPPTKSVAERFGASHSTAARWVGMARKEGYLGPAKPGRSGEGSD